jgi:hypothetical protein
MSHREGKMAAPNQHVWISVQPMRSYFQVQYQGTQEQLRRAGVVDAFMEERISTQRHGLKHDASGIPFSLRCKGAEWIAGSIRGFDGDGVTQVYRFPRIESEALTLPGVRDVWDADGPLAAAVSKPEDAIVTRDRPVGRWQRQVRWSLIENVIWPDWREVRNGFSRGMMPTAS